jgi:hypothetical protein
MGDWGTFGTRSMNMWSYSGRSREICEIITSSDSDRKLKERVSEMRPAFYDVAPFIKNGGFERRPRYV